MKNCPKCQASVSDTAKFCVKCGFNIRKFEEENEKKEYFCAECGTKFSGGTFCPECGYNIAKDLEGGDAPAPAASEPFGMSIDFGAMAEMAQDQLYEKEGFIVEGEVLTGYTGKKRSIVIRSSIEEIYDGAFEGNEVITFVEIEEGVRFIGKRAFANCGSLIRINIPSTVKKIYGDTFEGTRLEKLILTEYDQSILINCVSEQAKGYLKNGVNVDRYLESRSGAVTVNILELERDAQKAFEKAKAEAAAKKAEQMRREKFLNDLRDGIENGELSFGAYHQKNEKSKESIEWIVLEKNENKALLVSRYVLDAKPFDSEYGYWEHCSLRKWLNNEFFKAAFTDDEQKLIVSNTEKDKVFCLSEEELLDYFPSDEEREGYPTEYAKKRGASCETNGPTSWWTRTGVGKTWMKYGGYWCHAAKSVWDDGSLIEGSEVKYVKGVRPAMWINLARIYKGAQYGI